MSTRTRTGNLELHDDIDPDRSIIIDTAKTGLILLIVDRDTDQRAQVFLGGAKLDELAAEILRLRDERGN